MSRMHGAVFALSLTALFGTLAGCGTSSTSANDKATGVETDIAKETSGAKTAEAQMKNSSGEDVGTARLTQTETGVDIHLDASNLKPGTLAMHIHNNGVCEPPNFKSADGHYNPTNVTHGFDSANGPHLGDLRNIEVGQDGKATVDQTADKVTLGGVNSILGKALVIHGGPDDYKTQPSGGAGDPIACGVIEAE